MAFPPFNKPALARRGGSSVGGPSHAQTATATGPNVKTSLHNSNKPSVRFGPAEHHSRDGSHSVLVSAVAKPARDSTLRPRRTSAAGPIRVYSPVQEPLSLIKESSSDDEGSVTNFAIEAEGHGFSPTVTVSRIVQPVEEDMNQMNVNLRRVVGNRHPMLMAAADQIFGAGGKKLRPMIVFLVARATCELAGLR